jgi:hypothetical protein
MYAVLVIAILNIIGYLAVKNMDAVLFFVLVGLLTIYFSRNMIIVLVICIVSTNFYIGTTRIVSGFTASKEGLENQDGADTADAADAADAADTADADDADDAADAADEGAGDTGDIGDAVFGGGSTTIEGAANMKNKKKYIQPKPKPAKPHVEPNTKMRAKPVATTTKEGKVPTKAAKKPDAKKVKSGMQNLKPASLNESDDDDDNNKYESGGGNGGDDHSKISASKGNRVDYAQTLGQAYDNLQGIIGEDGVKGLTEQTKGLMTQQKVLMDNMKDMEPLLKSAQGFMNQVVGNGGLAGLSKLFDGKLFGAIAPSVADNGKDVENE